MTRVDTTLHHYADGVQLNIPEEAYCLFPAPRQRRALEYERFDIDTGGSTPDEVYVARHGRRYQNHIHVTETYWWKSNKGLPEGTTVTIQVTMGKGGVKQYRI